MRARAAASAQAGLRPWGLAGVLGLHLGLLGLLLYRPALVRPPPPAAPASLSISVRLLSLGAPPQTPATPAARAARSRPAAPQRRADLPAMPPTLTARPAEPAIATPSPPRPELSPGEARAEARPEAEAKTQPSHAATAPSPPLPPAAQWQAASAQRSWQAELLARLAQFRRYPEGARARREQGVSHVRLRLNRAGQLLALRLEHSSGHVELDRAALATVRAAVPLPAIPPELPEELELLLPVEFDLLSAR